MIGFRLLTEYYSFLYGNDYLIITETGKEICFRLLTEYYSFLLEKEDTGTESFTEKGFRLLTEYYSFL